MSFPYTVQVRLSNSSATTFSVEISSERDTVLHLHTKIKTKLSSLSEIGPQGLHNKNLRLIYCGKLLQPPNELVSKWKMDKEKYVLLAMLSDGSNKSTPPAAAAVGSSNDNNGSNSNNSNALGLDILRQTHHLEDSELSALRSIFAEEIRRDYDNDEGRFMMAQLRLGKELSFVCDYFLVIGILLLLVW